MTFYYSYETSPGKFSMKVVDESGKLIWQSIHPAFITDALTGELIPDDTPIDLGIMKNLDDIAGLERHLKNSMLLSPVDSLTVKKYEDGGNVGVVLNEGDSFSFRGKEYKITNISTTDVISKPVDGLPVGMVLKMPVNKFEELTGKKVTLKEISQTAPINKEESEIIRKAELIKYRNGENGRQWVDRNIADGYNKVIKIKSGATEKYYLDNEKTNLQLPISGDIRKYAQLVLGKNGKYEAGGQIDASDPFLDHSAYVRDTLIQKDAFNALPKEKRVAIYALIKEFEGIGYIDFRTQVGPDQIARMSEKKRNRLTENASKVFRIEDKIKQLLKSDEQLSKEQLFEKKKLLEGRKLQLTRRVSDLETIFPHKINSPRNNATKQDYLKSKEELAAVNAELEDIYKNKFEEGGETDIKDEMNAIFANGSILTDDESWIRVNSHRAREKMDKAGIVYQDYASIREGHFYAIKKSDLEKALKIKGISKRKGPKGDVIKAFEKGGILSIPGESQTVTTPLGTKITGIVKSIDIKKIIPSEPHATEENATAKGLAENLVDANQLPPLVIDNHNKIIDGNNRYAAAKYAGLTNLNAIKLKIPYNEFYKVRLAKGGKLSPAKKEKLIKGVAKQYEGKPVPKKYQEKYGKRYSKKEAKSVAYAIANTVEKMKEKSKEPVKKKDFNSLLKDY